MTKRSYKITLLYRKGSIKKIAQRRITASSIGQAYQAAMSLAGQYAMIDDHESREFKVTISPVRS